MKKTLKMLALAGAIALSSFNSNAQETQNENRSQKLEEKINSTILENTGKKGEFYVKSSGDSKPEVYFVPGHHAVQRLTSTYNNLFNALKEDAKSIGCESIVYGANARDSITDMLGDGLKNYKTSEFMVTNNFLKPYGLEEAETKNSSDNVVFLRHVAGEMYKESVLRPITDGDRDLYIHAVKEASKDRKEIEPKDLEKAKLDSKTLLSHERHYNKLFEKITGNERSVKSVNSTQDHIERNPEMTPAIHLYGGNHQRKVLEELEERKIPYAVISTKRIDNLIKALED
jgi:hypothetical protein